MKWLRGSWAIGKILGTELYLHYSMVLIIPLAWYIFKPENFREIISALLWMVALFICIVFHELGHAGVARVYNAEVKRIVLWPLGGATQLENMPKKPFQQMAILSAGLLVNLLLGALFGLLFLVFYLSSIFSDLQVVDQLRKISLALALLNLVLMALNVLPIYSRCQG